MAYFAEVSESNTVVRVVAVPDDQEHRGQEFMAADLGQGGTWIQTSYNTSGGVHVDPETRQPDGGTAVRFNYAGPGYTYDPDADAFYPRPPFPSWVLSETFVWEPPPPYPAAGNDYRWGADTTSWVEVPE